MSNDLGPDGVTTGGRKRTDVEGRRGTEQTDGIAAHGGDWAKLGPPDGLWHRTETTQLLGRQAPQNFKLVPLGDILAPMDQQR